MSLLLAICTLLFLSLPQADTSSIGAIDFFGYDGLPAPENLRAALPVREGDKITPESRDKIFADIKRSLKERTGISPSDVYGVCCDSQGRRLLYIGFPGKTERLISFNQAPRNNHLRLPKVAIEAQRDAEKAAREAALERGVFAEDDSRGFALSADPAARAKQLALHAYALRHKLLIRRVLAESADANQRQAAAEILGYAGISPDTIEALTRAALDPDEGVRNNAVRALGVMAAAKPNAAKLIRAGQLIGLLGSGIWTDRNKSSMLFMALTQRRDARLLEQLRVKALDSLIEIARWQNPGHADSARFILGRIAGIGEEELWKMVAGGQTESIIRAASVQRKPG